jgi:hypothetical protein
MNVEAYDSAFYIVVYDYPVALGVYTITMVQSSR